MKTLAQIFSATMILAISSAAFAHAQLDHAAPAVGSQGAAPTQVKIWFSTEVDPAATSIQVLDATGKQIDKKDSRQDDKDKSIMTVSLPANLPEGTYKVLWKARCTDGHDTTGDFTFVVKTKK